MERTLFVARYVAQGVVFLLAVAALSTAMAGVQAQEKTTSPKADAMGFVPLFTQDGETVSAAFKHPDDRETYKGWVGEALAPMLG